MTNTGTAGIEAHAKALTQRFVDCGVPCEIEAGPAGLVVYAAQPSLVRAVMQQLAEAPRKLGADATVSQVTRDADEPAATRWWGSVTFDWDALDTR